MAQSITFPLVLPYKFGPVQDKQLRDYAGRLQIAEADARAKSLPVPAVRTYDECRRDLSERLIAQAVKHVYGDNMPKDARRFYRGIQEALIDDAHELVLDGLAWKWFADTMKSDKVKVQPGDTSAWEMLIESIDSAQSMLAQAERAEG